MLGACDFISGITRLQKTDLKVSCALIKKRLKDLKTLNRSEAIMTKYSYDFIPDKCRLVMLFMLLF